MSGNIDILLWLPDVAAIGQGRLQDYCKQWLERPIAREYGITHLIVGSDLLLTVNLGGGSVVVSDRPFIPIRELLDYIIEQHFHEPAKRRELHAIARNISQRWGEVGYQYIGMAGRVGLLWLKCKNPACNMQLETVQQAVEGQRIHCPPCRMTCPICGHVDLYDGSDLYLRFAER